MKKKVKPKEIRRMVSGIHVQQGTRVSPPACYLTYEVWYDDGSAKFERGQTIYGAAHLLPQNKRDRKRLRPDLYNIIEATGQLTSLLEALCIDLDEVKL